MNRNTDGILDLLVVGGGINGAGIACDAAGRGLSVMLCEANDLASATSSASSKLIHGGLRYLEHYEFRLVRESLAEREVLLGKAGHIIWPMRFVLPHVPDMRPKWMLRAGLFLYDHLYRRRAIPASGAVDLASDAAGRPLKSDFTAAFDYWDCWVDDARLVVLNAMAAAALGAQVLTRTKVVEGVPEGDHWRVVLLDSDTGQRQEVRARAVVNAAGPWALEVGRGLAAGRRGAADNAAQIRLVKGSHIVVPRIAGADDAYILQNADRRVVFVLPYEQDFSLIGTTDTPFSGDPARATLDDSERDYLLDVVGRFFKLPLTAEDVVWSYAGVRPLYDSQEDNPSAVTRDYRLLFSNGAGGPPMLSVYGGKITTYRRLAEEAMDKLRPAFPGLPGAWTAKAKLPGGELEGGSFESHLSHLSANFPALEHGYLRALARRHGSLSHDVLGDARTMADLGSDFGHGLYEREVSHLKRFEWARRPDDVLWRRSKIGLHLDADARARAIDALAEVL
jgi:glycerol-3-phosphate dehydrogenase